MVASIADPFLLSGILKYLWKNLRFISVRMLLVLDNIIGKVVYLFLEAEIAELPPIYLLPCPI